MPIRLKYHRVTLPRSSASKERGRFYRSAFWQRLRAVILKRDVECQICHERPAVHVDHISNDHTDNRPENLRGLCHSCHSRKTRADMRGPQPEPASKPPSRQWDEKFRFG
jgi:5-methylcytosine-specific restriction endonuclease McrA